LILVGPAPILVEFRNRSSSVEVDCKDLREFLDTEWSNGDSKALQETTGIHSFLIANFHQYTLVCLGQHFGELVQRTADTWWETASQDF
jgi:hypothetical protein